jgi:iron(III) transport system ATP-binding protein
MSLVVLSEVTKRFHPSRPPAVDRLSLAIARGEILALLGPSGSGKTTILRLIAGFESPDDGRIMLGGRLVVEAGHGRMTAVPPEQRQVGIVFQDYALFPHLTVEANVGFGLHALTRAAGGERIREILHLVGLADLGRRFPHELSGGQQQRVALARALAPAPALLLLDEPFSNLDADLRAQTRDEVERVLRSTGTTAIFVTHDQEEAFTIADRVGVLNRGRLEQLGAPETIYHEPATRFVAEFVGAADFLPGIVTSEGIVTEIGTFANVQARAPGERVKVMLRPDDVTFVARHDGEAIILRRDFRGSETLYCLGLPSGDRVHSSQPSSAAFTAGTRVHLEVPAIRVVTFPAE